jgi:hypothetical protein
VLDFYEVLEQVLERLRSRGRVTYRALQAQFDLDDERLDVLKAELLFTHPVVDEDGRGLVWTGDLGTPEPVIQRGTEAESQFHALLRAVIGLLRGERRVTYRELKHVFRIDDTVVEEIREELTFKRLAIDEEDKGLVWTGEAQPAAAVIGSPAIADTPTVPSVTTPTQPPHVTEAKTCSEGPIVPPETIATDVPQDEPNVTPELTRSAPEAERRQLTVMFCDLADSTTLSQQHTMPNGVA